MKAPLASEVVAKLRSRPGRGGVRLSFAEADLLLLMLRARSLRPDERVRLREQVSELRRETGRRAARVERALEQSMKGAPRVDRSLERALREAAA